MLTLTTKGKTYQGFGAIEVVISLNAVASSFYLRYRLSSESSTIDYDGGNLVTLSEDGELLLTGYIDVIEKEIGEGANSLHIYGRSKTLDLIDCSLVTLGELKNQSLLQIIKKHTKPFSIDVTSNVGDGGKFEKWSTSPGESVWENIERGSRQKGVLVTGSRDGEIRLLEPGKEQEETQLIEGLNIISGNYTTHYNKLFSEYIVKGQSKDMSYDSIGVANNTAVKRHRPLLVLSETPINTIQARVRADWENIIRAMRSEDISITVNDWKTSPDGKLWAENKRTKVISKTLNLNQELLITGLKFSKEEDSFKRTEIILERLDSFKKSKTVNKVE